MDQDASGSRDLGVGACPTPTFKTSDTLFATPVAVCGIEGGLISLYWVCRWFPCWNGYAEAMTCWDVYTEAKVREKNRIKLLNYNKN